MNILFSLLLFANINAVGILPEETQIPQEQLSGREKRRNRRAAERKFK